MTASRRLVVRPRRAADLPELIRIAAAVQSADGYPINPPADWATWLSGPRVESSIVAELDGALAGHLSLAVAAGDFASPVWTSALGVAEEALLVVKRLFVDPPARRAGVARRLLEVATAEAQRRGRFPVLDVDASSEPANRLYRAAGWQPVGTAELPLPGVRDRLAAHCYVGPAPRADASSDR